MKNTRALILGLWKALSKRRKRQLKILMIFNIFTSIFELLAIGAVIPFLTVLSNPDSISEIYFTKFFMNFFNINKGTDLILPLAFLFAISALLSTSFRTINMFLNYRLSAVLGSDLGSKAYESILLQDYQNHLKFNSSKLIAGVSTYTDNSVNALNSILLAATNSFVSLTIIFGIIIIDYKIAFFSTIYVGFIYFLFAKIFKKIINSNSKKIAFKTQLVIKSLQEGIGSIRDIILDSNQEIYLRYFKKADLPKRKLSANNSFLGIFPRYLIEGISIFILSILVAVFSSRNQQEISIIVFLGTLAISYQKLLPAVQGAYNNWVAFQSYTADLFTLLELINLKSEEINSKSIKAISLNNKIEFKSVFFSYDKKKSIISEMNFEINKGERIGIIGETGSGKSTTIDLIMGLLKPTKGTICIDGYDIFNPKNREILFGWRKSIAHVPQNVFLSDSTIAENIAFGIPKEKISMSLVKNSAKKAQLDIFIESQKNTYSTLVGERGIKLSGGERQRICIARALYKKAKILIFDEATSALDVETELAAINAIEKLDKDLTIIMVSHRLSTLKRCDKIIKLHKGEIIEIGTPKKFLEY